MVESKWERLGLKVKELSVIEEFGSNKIVDKKSTIRNFKYIDITFHPIICFDIDNIGFSIKNFNELLEINNDKLCNHVYDISMNGGYHIFFYFPHVSKGNKYKIIKRGIHMDIISSGRIFIPPSHLGDKKYQAGIKNISHIDRIEDLGEIPEFLLDLK